MPSTLRPLWCLVIGAFLLGGSKGDSEVADGEQLAKRFRPYYKFSIDKGTEPCRPCSWQWFVDHSDLYRDKTKIAHAYPTNLLSFQDANILTTHDPSCVLKLRTQMGSSGGEPWTNVINQGAGLYAQCEDAGNGFVVLTYWTLFAYNKNTVGKDHEGDIIAVSLVYDRVRKQIVRASYGMHGRVEESFDLDPSNAVGDVTLTGCDSENHPVSVRAKRISVKHAYQYCSDRRATTIRGLSYEPSSNEVYMVEGPSSAFEHLAIFCEWGSHEPWPNASGSFPFAPKHNGIGVSFLPASVRYLGSFANPIEDDASFVLFNGEWGDDPKGLIFHRSCFYPGGRSKNHFKIPAGAFVDMDFFDGRGLRWPPAR